MQKQEEVVNLLVEIKVGKKNPAVLSHTDGDEKMILSVRL